MTERISLAPRDIALKKNLLGLKRVKDLLLTN